MSILVLLVQWTITIADGACVATSKQYYYECIRIRRRKKYAKLKERSINI